MTTTIKGAAALAGRLAKEAASMAEDVDQLMVAGPGEVPPWLAMLGMTGGVMLHDARVQLLQCAVRMTAVAEVLRQAPQVETPEKGLYVPGKGGATSP